MFLTGSYLFPTSLRRYRGYL